MTEDRYNQLMSDAEIAHCLTDEESAEGWHFCCDWDYLLIGPGMGELAACSCFEESDPRDKLCRDMRDRQKADMMEMHDGVQIDLDNPGQP